MDQNFYHQLQQWHEDDEFQKIIDAIEALPLGERNYELTCQLARAYNNLGTVGETEPYERAVEELLSVREQGEEDPLWHFRLGYAYFYLDREAEALPEFERVLELEPDDGDAKLFLSWCRESLLKGENPSCDPELYTEREMEAVEQFIADQLGEFPNVFHELVSPDIHVDICIIPPTAQQDYYTLVTMGMGAHRMAVPDELRDRNLERAELLIRLPSDWEVQSSDECWYWPIRWLKILARLPGEEDSWLGWGHTVDYGEPFAENTELCGSILISPFEFSGQTCCCTLPDGDEVNFYQVVPLYREEMDFKTAHDADTLLDLMGETIQIVDLDRPRFCGEMPVFKPKKEYALEADEIEQLLTDWEGPEGCIATDRITVDGCDVGYCYREEPTEGVSDSGWRFLAGDEPDEYMDDPENSDIYSLNTICNYDPEILPLLHAPVGSAFWRDEDGEFQPVEYLQPPSWLAPYTDNLDPGDYLEFDLCSKAGEELFEIWYYGKLTRVRGEEQLYIVDTDRAPMKIVAKNAATGEEILLFDGALHGYRTMFCETASEEQCSSRLLQKYDMPPSRIHIQLGYGIDYDEEEENYEFTESGEVLLLSGASMPWEQVKRDGFDYLALYFKDDDALIQFVDEELE